MESIDNPLLSEAATSATGRKFAVMPKLGGLGYSKPLPKPAAASQVSSFLVYFEFCLILTRNMLANDSSIWMLKRGRVNCVCECSVPTTCRPRCPISHRFRFEIAIITAPL